MKRTKLILMLLLFITQQSFAQTNASAKTIKALEAAETKMMTGITHHDPGYLKNDVAEDFFSINADGTTEDKVQMVADSIRGKFFSLFTYKMFDKKVRVYGNTGIITGRIQAFMKEAMAVEFLYTAVFVQQNGKWMYTGWHGTISKNSPKPPDITSNKPARIERLPVD